MQNNDESLNKIRVPKGVTKKKCGNSWYAVHKGLLTRHFQSRKVNHGQVIKQIIVPKGLRQHVLTVAHESVMAGHLGIRKT